MLSHVLARTLSLPIPLIHRAPLPFRIERVMNGVSDRALNP